MKKILIQAAAAVSMVTVAGGLAWWARGVLAAKAGHASEISGEIKTTQTMYNCAMHPWIIRDKPGACPICGMALVPMKDHGHGAPPEAGPGAVRIDPVMVQNIGVKTEEVGIRELSKEVLLSGRLDVDETRQVSVNAKIMGWVEKLHADYLGKRVRAGEVLMELYSPDLLTTQEEYLQALRYLRALPEGATEATRRGAEELSESARRRLEYWDIPASAIERLGREGKARRTLPIVSPAAGVLTAKNVVEGQNIMAGMELLRIADLSRIWALGEVYQEDLSYVKVGQTAEVRLAYLPGKVFPGKVSFISPVLDPQSKTAQVRVELRNNREMRLRPEMVADIRIAFPLGEAVAIPRQSVIRTGKRNLAIVSLGHGYFEPREVRLGATAGDYVQVLEGLAPGDILVTSSQFLIDSESNLKAAVMGMSTHNHGGNLGPAPKNADAAEAPRPAQREKIDAHAAHAVHERVEAPEAFRRGLGSLFEKYADLQRALAADDLARAAEANRELGKALGSIRNEGLEDAAVWKDGREGLAAAFAAMEKAKRLEDARGLFQDATNALAVLLRRYGYVSESKAHVFHCSMAMDGQGADWMQADAVLKNPYLGSAMPDCGESRGSL